VGYYFLSQLLRLPNLMDRSRAYWRGLLKALMLGERNREAAKYARGERAVYFAFGLLSFLYNLGLRSFIVIFIGGRLIEWFHLPGLFGAAGIAVFYARQPLRQSIAAITSKTVELLTSRSEGHMAENNQTTTTNSSPNNKGEIRKPRWRRLVPITVGLLAVAALLMPWSASVGNYGTLTAVPNQEAIIRAPESATLIELRAQPGQRMDAGAVIGRMGNLELEEQIVQVQSDLARANADHDRLLGALRARSEMATRAELQLNQRQHDFDEINSERRQIERRRIAEADAGSPRVVAVASFEAESRVERIAPAYPAALAVLQSDVDSFRAQLAEAHAQRDRARRLHAQGIVPRSESDAAETRAATLGSALAAAREKLEAALIEHRRKHTNTTTELSLARSDLGVERLQIEKLSGELRSMRAVIGALEERRELLERKRAQFELVTPRTGAVFGEELPRLAGNYFQKGAEICRVADTSQLLVRIQVPEREIGDVRASHPVRLKARSFPDRVFRGAVTKIGGESEPDGYGQATYRVELTIDNGEGLPRPGMTAFARIDFDRQMIGRILLHKIKQALRPELWML
jgi:multidrug resistance efflux pump